MSAVSVADFVDLLRKSRHLDAARMEQVIKAQARFPDAVTLAKELVRRGWLTRDQARGLLRGQPAAPAAPAVELVPATDGAAEPPPPAPAERRRRRGGWLLALLALLLLGGGGAGVAVWWHGRGDATSGGSPLPSDKARAAATTAPASGCSDDSDPKYLEQLEFGDPLRTPFDPKSLDALKDRPIPALEVYPWQPKELVAVLGEHRMRGSVLAASPDGTRLAVAGLDTFIRIGPIDTLHERAVLAGHGGGVIALAWSPKGDVLASAGGDGSVRLWDVRDPEKVPESVVLEWAQLNGLAFSGDGKYLIGAGPGPQRSGLLWTWEVGERKLLHKRQQTAPLRGLAFSPVPGDYRALLGGGPGDGRLYLWQGDEGKQLAAIDFKLAKEDEWSALGQVAFSPDGKRAVSAHYARDPRTGRGEWTARVWDLGRFEKGQERHVLSGFVDAAPLLAFAPDNSTIATARLTDNGVWLWDAASGKQVRRVATSGNVYALLFLARGEGTKDRVAFAGTISNDYNVHVHAAEDGKELRPPAGHFAAVLAVAVSPDGRTTASGSHDMTARVWDLETAAQRHPAVSAGGQVWNVGYHPDGRKAFYCGAGTATPAFVDVETGKAWGPAYGDRHHGAVTNAAVTADGHYALTGGYNDASVRLWSLKDGKQVRFFPSAAGGVASVALSPDGRRALRTAAGSLQLLHLRCQEVRQEWGAGTWNTFLPDDGRVAILGGATGALWDVGGDKPKAAGSVRLGLAGAAPGDITPDGRRLAAVVGGRAAAWDLKSERPVWEWTPPAHFGGVRGVALSADGRHLLSANGDGTVYVIQLP